MLNLLIIFIKFGLLTTILISYISNILISYGYLRENKFAFEIGKKMIYSTLFLFIISLTVFTAYK